MDKEIAEFLASRRAKVTPELADPPDHAACPRLSTRSEPFRIWWAAHNVRFHQTGVKRLHHPIVGELELSYEVMELSADSGTTVSVYTAELGSRSQEGLDLLASWASTPEPDTETLR